MDYILNILIGIDQLFNVLLMGAPDETLSARAYRAHRDNKVFGKVFMPIINTLFWFQSEHCKEAYYAEITRKQYGSSYQ